MKINLPITVILFFLPILIECNMPRPKPDGFNDFQQGAMFETHGDVFKEEGNVDSAKICYKKSIAIFHELLLKNHNITDTFYTRKLSRLNNRIGIIFDYANKPDSALPYYLESLNWARLSKDNDMLLGGSAFAGYAYFRVGRTKQDGSDEQRILFSKAIPYLKNSIRMSDSLKVPANGAVFGECITIQKIYKQLGDSVQANFYSAKVEELKKLHP